VGKMFEIEKVTNVKIVKDGAANNSNIEAEEGSVFLNCDPEDCTPAMPCTPNCSPQCVP